MAQVQRIDLLQNNFACATAKFPATYPVFLSGKVTRDVFFADVEELNKIISTATAITRFYPVNAVVVGAKGASAPPAPSGFCTQCGAPVTSDARFCGACGAAR